MPFLMPVISRPMVWKPMVYGSIKTLKWLNIMEKLSARNPATGNHFHEDLVCLTPLNPRNQDVKGPRLYNIPKALVF